MSQRILVVNPNTSPEVTEAYLTAARALAPVDIVLTGVTGRFGARIVSTEAENIIAGHAALDLVAEHARGFSAIILAISFDTGLDALRSVLPMPVIGITAASLRAAATGGRRVGIVFFGEVSRSLYERVVATNGIVPVGMEAIAIGDAADYLSPEAKDAVVSEACMRLAAQGAEAVVICGAAIVGMAERLAPRLPVTVHDGLEAVRVCMSGAGACPADHAHRPIADSAGLPPKLAALLRGDMR
jgi:allantoin racemase